MCAHSSSGKEITDKIGGKLYPFIASLFQEAIDFNQSSGINENTILLFERFYLLKSEFESLRNYELKLVFPSVLKVFNTKDNTGDKPSINIVELQRLTQNKEKMILELVSEIEEEAEKIRLPKKHPVYQLLFVFQTSFVQEKQQWNTMLNGWGVGCACFVAAQQMNDISGN